MNCRLGRQGFAGGRRREGSLLEDGVSGFGGVEQAGAAVTCFRGILSPVSDSGHSLDDLPTVERQRCQVHYHQI
jgi:hypothetical protein